MQQITRDRANFLPPEQLYCEAAQMSAELSRHWANDARRYAKSIDPLAYSLINLSLNFLITLFLITLLR